MDEEDEEDYNEGDNVKASISRQQAFISHASRSIENTSLSLGKSY